MHACMQMSALWQKYRSSYWRNPSYNYLRFVVTVAVALLYGTIYYKAAAAQSPLPFSSIQSIGGLVNSSVGFLGLTALVRRGGGERGAASQWRSGLT